MASGFETAQAPSASEGDELLMGNQPFIGVDDLQTGQRATLITEDGHVHGAVTHKLGDGETSLGLETFTGEVRSLDLSRIRLGELALFATPRPEHAVPFPTLRPALWPVIVASEAKKTFLPAVIEGQLALSI